MPAPAQLPSDAADSPAGMTGLPALYAGALRHLAGRVARSVGERLTRTGNRLDPPQRRRSDFTPLAVQSRHPSAWPAEEPGNVVHITRSPIRVYDPPTVRGGIRFPGPPEQGDSDR